MKYLKKIFETRSNNDFKTDANSVIDSCNHTDISHILQIGYQIVANYEILDTPDKINKFVSQTYRQCRIILKKNIKQLRNIQCVIKQKKKPLNE